MISAVIITYNEESNIRRCLEALTTLVDEIIVVDSFSTDATPEICGQMNVRFFSQPWEGYSAAKNFGNAQSQYEYILSVDADEVVSEELFRSILSIKYSLKGAYKFNRLTNYAGKWVHHCGWYPDAKIRLFPRSKAKWKGDFVHETLWIDESLTVSHLKGDLLHYSYHSKADHEKRIEKYSTLHAEKMFAEGKKGGMFSMIFSPLAKFFRNYFLQLGFLDGCTGFTVCRLSAKAVFLKYKKLNEKYKKA
jgi:glycosyltransferase involved in cell wall biosynthesis